MVLSSTALWVLGLLALQNTAKNIVMRAAVRGKADFLYSAAVIATEAIKCLASALWVILIDGGSFGSILSFLRSEWRGTVMLAVPAAIYNFQKTLEYVALRNLNAAVFSVLVQTKLFTTAICAVGLMGKSLRKSQLISLVLLVVGCILAQLDPTASCTTSERIEQTEAGNKFIGIIATLCIAFSSGFASVYTEKVIKANDKPATGAERSPDKESPLPIDSATAKHSSDLDDIPKDFEQGFRPAPSSASIESATSLKAITAAKARSPQEVPKKKYGLAYTQIQLAFASLIIEGLWAVLTDFSSIQQRGIWYGFGWEAWLAVSMTALGGIAVAAVLKFADAILKGYATAISVVLTGLASHFLFGTVLNIEYGLGMINVLASMVLYNSTALNDRAI